MRERGTTVLRVLIAVRTLEPGAWTFTAVGGLVRKCELPGAVSAGLVSVAG